MNEYAVGNVSPYAANSVLFKEIFSNKPFAPLFLKSFPALKLICSYIFKEHVLSGGTIYPSVYICIKIVRLPLDIHISTQYISIQILGLMPIFKLKMRI